MEETAVGQPSDRAAAKGMPDWPQWGLALAAILSALTVGAGLVFSIRQANEQQRVVERGQETDRFGKAVDQLGSDAQDVRFGGIYALESLMHDAPGKERAVIAVLGAYVRVHAKTITEEGVAPAARQATRRRGPAGR